MRNKTRLGALLLTMALLIVMLSIGIGATAEPVVTDTPSTARPVLDFSYLPKDQVLTETEGIRPLYSSEQVDEDLVVKAESRSGKDYLHYDVLTQEWCSGKYVDLLVAKDGGKAVTDWSGATTVWFYVETEGTVYCDLLLGVDNSGSGSVQGWFNSLFEGAKYYVEQDGAFVAKATTSDNWNHIVLPENYTGWVGVDVAEGIACKAGHFQDQTFEGHDDTIYGLGFDVDAGDLYVRDFRVSGIAAGLPEKVTISPDDAKPVLNFSYLPKNQVLTEVEGVQSFYPSLQPVDEDLVVSVETRSEDDWIHYEIISSNYCAGKYIDMLVARDGGRGVTDWTGATTVWFYVETEGAVSCDLLLGVDDQNSGMVQSYFSSMFTGAKYYVEDDDGFIATYTTGANWNHIVLPANYAGWVGVDVAEGLKCMAGHFQDQTFEGHDDTIYGLGFDVDAGELYVRDFRVDGIAKGLPEKVNISPDDAKPILDLSYLPKDEMLTEISGVGGIFNNNVDQDVVVSVEERDGKDWLFYERISAQWHAGVYVDLLMAENHAVTDWSDGSVFWFYVDTLDKVFINLCLAVDNDPETGMVQGYFNSEFAGAKYYMEQDGGFIELSTTADNWNHIVIDAGYSGWIGVDLQEGLQCKTTELADQTVDGNLGHVYGVGFYLELGDMYVRDFRVAGIAEGVEVPDGPDTSDTSDTSDASDTSDIPNTSDPSDPDSSKGDSSSPETGVDSLAGAAVLLAASALLMVGYQAFARKKAAHNR